MRLARFILGVLIVGLIYIDSYRFFSREYVNLKLRHYSGQYDWNVFFPQSIVYNNSSFRYQLDFKELNKIVVPNSLLISDMATSYYSAALLPVYIRNMQPHQGRRNFKEWSSIFDQLDFCYLDAPKSTEKIKTVLNIEANASRLPIYVLLNKDGVNINNHRDCMANRSKQIAAGVQAFATKIFSGQYLELYQIDPRLL